MEEKELKEIVINLQSTLYGVANNTKSKVTAEEVGMIKTIMEGRMVLGQIPYSYLNFGCSDCIRDMIFQIISWYESPSFKPPVTSFKVQLKEAREDVEYLEGVIKVADAKLSNERFVENAPSYIIENEHKKKADAEVYLKQKSKKGKGK